VAHADDVIRAATVGARRHPLLLITRRRDEEGRADHAVDERRRHGLSRQLPPPFTTPHRQLGHGLDAALRRSLASSRHRHTISRHIDSSHDETDVRRRSTAWTRRDRSPLNRRIAASHYVSQRDKQETKHNDNSRLLQLPSFAKFCDARLANLQTKYNRTLNIVSICGLSYVGDFVWNYSLKPYTTYRPTRE